MKTYYKYGPSAMVFCLMALLFIGGKAYGQLPFADGFESGNLNSGAWTISGNAQISKQFPAQGQYCLKGPATWGISKRLNSSPSNFSFIEFKAKASQTNTVSLVFRIMDSLVHTAAGMFFNATGEIVAVNGTLSTVIMPYDTGKWYSFKFTMNMTNRTYDMFIDGQLKANDFGFNSSAFTTTNVFTWSSVAASGNNWIDDVYLYASNSGIGNIEKEVGIKVFPNPFKDQLWIEGNLEMENNLVIYNTCGKMVYETTGYGSNHIIDLSCIIPGIYFVKVINNENRVLFLTKLQKL